MPQPTPPVSGSASRAAFTSDTLTILTSAGPRLTKVWDSAGGKPQGYERAQQVAVREVVVSGIRELSALLSSLESKPNSCLIRGLFVGHDKAAELYPAEIAAAVRKGKALAVPKEGYTLRRGNFFSPQPLHLFYIDIDHFKPTGIDPVLEPERAIDQYLSKSLPRCFGNATYHWQLSSGAGHPDNLGVLKAHVAFWLAKPVLGEDLELWVKSLKLDIDVSVFRTVQPNYTAAPVFINGVIDPVPRRSGLSESLLDINEVDLVIEPALLLRARAERKQRQDILDPRDKEGPVGLFCRTFEMEQVVERWLPDVFEFVTDTRLNWLQSQSGAAEGAGITDNRQGIFNTHSGDSFNGRAANKWDLVRHYKYGHLDAQMDEAERVLLGIGSWPSNVAMLAMARALPEMQTETIKAGVDLVDGLAAAIAAVNEPRDLENVIALQIASVPNLGDVERALLTSLIQSRAKELGVKLEVAVVRGWLRAKFESSFAHINDDGYPLCTLENFEILLARLGVTIRYNVISKMMEVLVPGAAYTQDNRDNVALGYLLSECEKARMPTKFVQQFMLNIGDANLYNPVASWVESYAWDGVSRLQEFYETVQVDSAAMEEPLKRLLLRKWLVQSMAAATIGGQQYRGILTFTGSQNIGKTTWFKNLAPAHLELVLTGHTLDTKSKDSQLLALRHWIVELGEVDATFRKSDLSALKSFIGGTRDSIRRPYAAAESNYDRRTVFGASVNDTEFLADKTGNSRFWTIPVTGFAFDHGVDMQQLWAEVLCLVQAGEGWSLSPAELVALNRHNEDFETIDPISERIASGFSWGAPTGWDWLTATQVLIVIGIQEPKKSDTISASTALRKLNGGQRRKTGGRILFAVPAAGGDFLGQ
jgi:hypothetical protein